MVPKFDAAFKLEWKRVAQIWITPSRFGNALPKLVEDGFLLYPFPGIRKSKFMPVIHDFVLERFCFLFFCFFSLPDGGVGRCRSSV